MASKPPWPICSMTAEDWGARGGEKAPSPPTGEESAGLSLHLRRAEARVGLGPQRPAEGTAAAEGPAGRMTGPRGSGHLSTHPPRPRLTGSGSGPPSAPTGRQ